VINTKGTHDNRTSVKANCTLGRNGHQGPKRQELRAQEHLSADFCAFHLHCLRKGSMIIWEGEQWQQGTDKSTPMGM